VRADHRDCRPLPRGDEPVESLHAARMVEMAVGEQDLLDGEALGEARLPVEVSARLDLSLTFTDPDLRVAVRFREVEGRTGGAFGGSAVVTEEGIRGPLGFSLTPRGHVTLETLPEVDPDARQVIDPAALAREIFPRFPSHPVSPGERWVDTLTYETREEEGTLRAERVLTYTLRGDTTESGRTLLRIVSSGRTRYVFEGTRMGVETRQTLEGPVRGDLLWDPRARLPVRVRSEKELEGTMELPSLGAPSISLELQGITRAEWVGG